MTPVEPTYGINYLKQSRGCYLCSCLSNVLTVKHSHFKSLLHRLCTVRSVCLITILICNFRMHVSEHYRKQVLMNSNNYMLFLKNKMFLKIKSVFFFQYSHLWLKRKFSPEDTLMSNPYSWLYSRCY